MVEIIRQRDPVLLEDLKRDFRPLVVMEGNFLYRAVGEDMRVRLIHRRQRKIRFVSLDQDRVCEVVEDLGPATQDDPWIQPCDGEVEWGESQELIAWSLRKRAERAEREAWVKPLRTAAFIQAISDSTDEAVKRAVGSSTFGEHVRIQRERA